MWFTRDQLVAWASGQSPSKEIPILGVSRKCGGCGQTLPKNLSEESYLMLGGEIYHMTETCIANGVENMRTKDQNWDWAFKENEDAASED